MMSTLEEALFKYSLVLAMNVLVQTLQFVSSDSLCSTFVSLYTVLFLYIPNSIFVRFLLSPVVPTTLILLLYLLRLGASQNSDNKSHSEPPNSAQVRDLPDYDQTRISPRVETGGCSEPVLVPDPESFVEWDVRAPLEVIYEEYDEGDDGAEEAARESDRSIIQRYASLSLVFPESDGDSSSEGDFPETGDGHSPETAGFRWEEEEDDDEDDREGLIEIELNEKRSDTAGEVVDEDNLIEIDLSPASVPYS